MREFLSRRPTPAMAVAFIALLAALSGTAVALPGTNSVDSGDIKNGQVKGKDLANNAVTGKKVKNRSLTGADVRDNSLTGADVNEGTLGQVPSAASAGAANTANSANTANTATTANTANTVGGFSVRKIDYRSAASATVTTILDLEGLTMTVSCAAGSIDNFDVTGPVGSNISMWGYDGDDTVNDVDDAARDIENFSGGTLDNVEDVLGDASANSVGVQFTYHRDNGDVVTGQFNMDEGGAPNECIIGGTAMGG